MRATAAKSLSESAVRVSSCAAHWHQTAARRDERGRFVGVPKKEAKDDFDQACASVQQPDVGAACAPDTTERRMLIALTKIPIAKAVGIFLIQKAGRRWADEEQRQRHQVAYPAEKTA